MAKSWRESGRTILNSLKDDEKSQSSSSESSTTGGNTTGSWRESGRNILKSVGYSESQPIRLISKDGKSFGTISYDAYVALKHNRIDSYKPKNDEEANNLNSFIEHESNEKYKLKSADNKSSKGAKDKADTIVSNYVPSAYSMTKSEYNRRRVVNPDMPEFGSYEYFKNQEKTLRPIMDEIADDDERRDDAKLAWASNYKNEKSTPENKAEGERLENKFKYQDAIIAEYINIDAQLKKFEVDGVHYDKDGNIDTKSGSAEAKYAQERYDTIASATALSNTEFALGFKRELPKDKQAKYDQGKKMADLVKVEYSKEKAYDAYEKNKDNVYENNLIGRITGGYKLGDIGISKNNANYASFNAGVGDLEAADVYNALSERIQENNYKTFQNKTKGQKLVSAIAQYLPQARDQLTYEVLGRAVGIATGSYGVGNFAGSVGSAEYMYRQTAGASFERLLREGDLSIEDAKKLASSEALSSSVVEFGLSAATGMLWKTSDFVTKGAIKNAVSETTETMAKRAASSLMAKGISEKGAKLIVKSAITAGKTAIDGMGEGLEEWIQEGMSIKADKYAKEGKTVSAFELLVNAFDLSEYSSDDFSRMNQSFLIGAIIGFGQGGFRASLTTATNKVMSEIANVVDTKALGKEIIRSGDTDVVEIAINMIKETASEKELKTIDRIETAISNGNKLSAKDVGTVVKSALNEATAESTVYNALTSENLTDNQIESIITSKETKDAFERITGTKIEGSKEEQMAIVRSGREKLTNAESKSIAADGTITEQLTLNVGDSFIDRKLNLAIKVVARDTETTTIEIINRNGNKSTKQIPNNTANRMVTDKRYRRVNMATSATSAPVDVAEKTTTTPTNATKNVAPTTTSSEPRTISLTRVGNRYEVYGEDAIALAEELDMETTRKVVNGVETDVLALPKKFAEGLREEYGDEYNFVMIDATSTSTTEIDQTSDDVNQVVDAMRETFRENAEKEIKELVQKNFPDCPQDEILNRFAQSLIKAYETADRQIGRLSRFFTDGGKKVMAAMDSVLDKTVEMETKEISSNAKNEVVANESSAADETTPVKEETTTEDKFKGIFDAIDNTLTPQAKRYLNKGQSKGNYEQIAKSFMDVYVSKGTITEDFGMVFTDGGKAVDEAIRRALFEATTETGPKKSSSDGWHNLFPPSSASSESSKDNTVDNDLDNVKTVSEDTKVLKNEQKSDTIKSKAETSDSKSDSIFIDDRSYDDVSSRKVKAFQFENPEVKPFYADIANELIGDLKNTIKGERYMVSGVDAADYGTNPLWMGIKRRTSEAIARIKDATNATYDEIENALQRIINDEGQENIALAKKIELVIDDMLSDGYTDFEGNKIPVDEDYIALKERLSGKKYESETSGVEELPFDVDEGTMQSVSGDIKEATEETSVEREDNGNENERSERTVERRTVHNDGNVERTDGERTGRGGERVSRKTGNAQKTETERTVRKKIATTTFDEVKREHYTPKMNALEQGTYDKYGVVVKYFYGKCIDDSGVKGSAFYYNGVLYIQADAKTSMESRIDHEITHHFGGSNAMTKFRNSVKAKMPKAVYDSWYSEIKEAYGDVLMHYLSKELAKSNYTLTDAELQQLMDEYIEEEMLAKLNGGQVPFATEYKAEIEAFRKEIENYNTKNTKSKATSESKTRNIPAEYTESIDAGGEESSDVADGRYDVDDVKFSEKPFAEQVDAVLKGEDTTSTHLQISEHTPKLLLDLGLNDKPILITSVHTKTALGHKVRNKNIHYVSTEVFKRLPQLIEDPAIVMESTKNGSIVMFVNALDKGNNPVVCSIKIDGNGNFNNVEVEANVVTSVYGKDTNPIGFIEKAVDDKRVLYWNKKMSQKLFDTPGLQLPDNINALDSNVIIRKISENVNTKFYDVDSLGKTLTEAQQEYFKDSKVRDENGNLLVVYHGTRNKDFTVFKRNHNYYTDNRDMAESYAPNSAIYEGYLNITNPYIIDANGSKWSAIPISDEVKKMLDEAGSSTFKEKGKWCTSVADIVSAISDLVDEGEADYDGVIVRNVDDTGSYYKGSKKNIGTDYITFKSEQFKNTDNTNPTTDPDIRFDLSEPVEETRDLIAVHNMQVSELERTLDLGGLPMPSIAIIKAQRGHSEYGDVSLVFNKDTIDPKADKNNKVYGGDAWTPTYPRIEYKPSEKVAKKISDKYYALSKQIGNDETRPLYSYVYDLEEQLNRNKGEAGLIEELYDDTRMMQLYLLDSGKDKVETVKKETRTELTDAEVEMNEFFIKELGAEVMNDLKWDGNGSPMAHRTKFLESHGDTVRDVYKKLLTDVYHFSEEQVQNVLDSTKKGDYIKFVRDASNYAEKGRVTIKTEDDFEATQKAIKDAAGKDYRKWVDSLFKGIEEKSGIRNNADYFTNSGNRRSWEALHWENNLENVVKVMKSQNDVGSAAFFTGHGIWGVSAKDYRSIEEIKADSDRLKQLPEEEYNKIKEGFGERLTEIANSIMDKSERNPFIAADNAMECIVDAVRQSKTKLGILNNLKQYKHLTVTKKTIEDIVSLVTDIANMPTEYFEAKPKRAVELNEIATAIIPDSTSESTKARLDDMGIKYLEYESGNEDARLEALNFLEDVRFDLDTDGILDLGDLWKEYNKIYGTIPKGENPIRDVDVPKKISEKDVVSQFARTMMEAGVTPDWAVSEFEKAILNGEMTHEVIEDKKTHQRVLKKIKDIGFEEALRDWEGNTREGVISKENLVLGMELYNQCVTNKDVRNAMKIAAELAAEATRAGQTLQACRMLKLMTPDGQLYYLEKSIQKMNEEFKQKLGDKFKDIELDESLMEEFFTETDETKRNELYDKICQNIADQIPSTLRDKWDSWCYLAMLGNPKTHIRNIVGNAVFIPSIRMKTYIGAIIEATAGIDRAERTKSLRKSKDAVAFAKEDAEKIKKLLAGENAKYAITNDIESKRTIFKPKWLEYLRRKNFDFLEKEDWWFLKAHYTDALARLITARKIDIKSIDAKTLDTLRKYAVKEAQAATYRDANAIADGLNQLQRKLERSDNKALRATGILVEGAMPFKKTPLNIAKQGINYSPIGLLNGVYKGLTKIKQGKATATDVIDDFAKGLTGTGMMLLGLFLAKMGWLCGADDETKKEKEFDKMVGEQSYSIKIGNGTYTIDWMTPSNLSLFIGAKLFDLTKDEFTFADVTSAISTIAEPLMELSVFSGLNGVIESAQYSDSEPIVAIAYEMVTSYLMQGLPTIGGQISRMLDGSKREYYYVDKNSDMPKGLQTLIGKASSKIPFASHLFQPAIDEWGREETYGNVVERAFENTVSPGYYAEDNYTKVDKEIRRVFEETGDTAVLPTLQQKYYKEDGVTYHMSAEDYTEVKKKRGELSFQYVEKLIRSYKYRSMSDVEKADAIAKCYKQANKETKEEMLDRVKRNSKR